MPTRVGPGWTASKTERQWSCSRPCPTTHLMSPGCWPNVRPRFVALRVLGLTIDALWSLSAGQTVTLGPTPEAAYSMVRLWPGYSRRPVRSTRYAAHSGSTTKRAAKQRYRPARPVHGRRPADDPAQRPPARTRGRRVARDHDRLAASAPRSRLPDDIDLDGRPDAQPSLTYRVEGLEVAVRRLSAGNSFFSKPAQP